MDYAFNFTGHGVFTPDGRATIEPSDVDKTNKEKEQAEIEWLKTGPDNVFLYYQGSKEGQPDDMLATWLGTTVGEILSISPRRHIGFGYNTYRRAVTARIYGRLYHGWYMESSGDYCRLKKSKRQ